MELFTQQLGRRQLKKKKQQATIFWLGGESSMLRVWFNAAGKAVRIVGEVIYPTSNYAVVDSFLSQRGD